MVLTCLDFFNMPARNLCLLIALYLGTIPSLPFPSSLLFSSRFVDGRRLCGRLLGRTDVRTDGKRRTGLPALRRLWCGAGRGQQA